MLDSADVHLSTTLADLADRIRRGDSEAEAEFVGRYARGLRAIIRRACGDRSAVDDLCHDALRIALEKIRTGDLRDPTRLSGFVVAIAHNVVIQHGRRLASRRALDAVALNSLETTSLPDQLAQVIAGEEATIVRRVLDELPNQRDRNVLIQFYLEDRDKDEICRNLRLTREHFNRVLYRARGRYRELYERRARESGRADSLEPR